MEFPLLPLREMVIFPQMSKTFYVGRKDSIEAVQLAASQYDNQIFIITQKDSNIENPNLNDIFEIGTLSEIKKITTGPDKKIIKITITGLERAKIKDFYDENIIKKVILEKLKSKPLQDTLESETILNYLVKDFKKYINLTKIPFESIKQISESKDEDMLINSIIQHLKTTIEKKIELLSETDPIKRLTILDKIITDNIDMLYLEKKINFEVRKKIDKSQKEYYLNEQIKEIQKELGQLTDDDFYTEENLLKKLEALKTPEYAKEKALKELRRLNKIPALSPEAGVIRTYIDCILELPWGNILEESNDLNRAKKILNEEHYSLKKVKNRILEYLAVRQLNKMTKGPILCFVGPPGTGKTSLGKSVAHAVGKEFIRISLGGVRDEAEIRGHRRTYLGALPGKIIQSMKKISSNNPVFLLDEIDKMSSDFRGDPSSALLEVLDPEQNNQFVDHYLEIPYNLSNVMFITTANSKQGIPYPLLDRMEIINISSYTEIEKLNIAKKFLLQKEQLENGLTNIDIKISNACLIEIIRSYTMEAGVRSLQRQIATICRKIAKNIVLHKKEIKSIVITKRNLEKFLGKKKFIQPEIDKVLDIGVSHGLAWSEFGGSILPIEVVLYPGTGKINLTGKIGDVMQESAHAAFSYIRANADLFNIKYNNFYKDYDVHIHFPEGAIPKDGPSAGIAITCGILSALTKVPVNAIIAMTGEITLTGKVLAVGGLLEKTIAALKHRKEKIIIPFENQNDILEFPKNIKDRIEFIYVKKALEVIILTFNEKIFKNKVERKKASLPQEYNKKNQIKGNIKDKIISDKLNTIIENNNIITQ
ncbi:MAG: endopeptidase La [Spirochaetes bacterium]|nr:endopeptidase La [Spirochaetota bacterium]